MIDCKCSFAMTLIKGNFSCEKAKSVTRRGGLDIACTSELASERCKQIYKEFKIAGLPAFDAEDDLLKTPASVFTKIQFGGLLGLSRLITNSEIKIETVDNIYQLLEQSVEHYESLSDIPYSELVDTMRKYKIKRKKRQQTNKVLL